MSNFKTSSSSKRSAVEHTKIHNDNEIATDLNDSNFVKEVFNKDKCITLKVITVTSVSRSIRLNKTEVLINSQCTLASTLRND